MRIYTTAQIIPQVFNGAIFECITEPYAGMRIQADDKWTVQYCKERIKHRPIEMSKMFWDSQFVKVVKVRR